VNPVARQDARGRGLDVRESLHRLDDATADVVISNHALEHTLQPFEHLREIHRVLVPGGRLVLHLPVGDWRTERRVNPDDINGHLYSWTSQNIYNLLTEAGFVDVEPHVVTFAWPPYAHRLARIPALYRVTGTAWSVLRRIRELRTTATKPA
jgi:SAM-dependent methyltransferase